MTSTQASERIWRRPARPGAERRVVTQADDRTPELQGTPRADIPGVILRVLVILISVGQIGLLLWALSEPPMAG